MIDGCGRRIQANKLRIGRSIKEREDLSMAAESLRQPKEGGSFKSPQ
jgi:hypothetical protein